MANLNDKIKIALLNKKIEKLKYKCDFNMDYIDVVSDTIDKKNNRIIFKADIEKRKRLYPLEVSASNKKPGDKEVVLYQDSLNEEEKKLEALKSKLELEKKDKIHNLSSKVEADNKVIQEKIKELEVELEKYKAAEGQLDDGVILDVNQLLMQFGGLKAVDNLSFKVKEGEIFGLIGPNGAGKTTVFNCITQFYKPTSGTVMYKDNNHRTIDLTKKKVHDVIKTGIVRTFQNVELIWELSVLDNLLVAGHTLYRANLFEHIVHSNRLKREEKIVRAKAMKILERLNLLQYAYVIPFGLPYGILKKIELARTLMVNPRLIILDEPAAGLNDAETEELARTIKQIGKDFNCTIFLVEHDMGLVMSICDTICAISFGKMLAIGTPEEIQNNKQVQEAYLGGE